MGKQSKKKTIMMVVVKGGLSPADERSRLMLRDRNYKVGDIVSVEIRKCRNPGFNRLAHQIGVLLINNLEEFSLYEAHDVLKRLQLESGIECDEMAIKVQNLGIVLHRIPRSLSFDSMDEDVFHDFVSKICKHIVKTYWPDMTPEQIEEMAELMVD